MLENLYTTKMSANKKDLAEQVYKNSLEKRADFENYGGDNVLCHCGNNARRGLSLWRQWTVGN